MFKRILLSLAGAALLSVSAKAQNNYGCFTPMHKATTLFGIQLTPGVPFLSHQNNYGNPKLNSKPSFKCGIGVNLGFLVSNKDVIQIEANYQPMGNKYSGTTYKGPLERDVNLVYWSIPVLYKHYFFNDELVESVSADKPGKLKWYIEGGPYVAMLASVDVKNTINGQSVTIQEATATESGSNTTVQDVGDPQQLYLKNDWGFQLGCGLDIALMEGLYINLGMRGIAGLKDINPEKFRAKDPQGNYKPTQNGMVGARLGLQMRF